jgi:hypothetical protein
MIADDPLLVSLSRRYTGDMEGDQAQVVSLTLYRGSQRRLKVDAPQEEMECQGW